MGYNAIVGTNSSILALSTTEKVIGLIDFNAGINTTTGFSDISGNAPFCAITSNGSDCWFSSQSGGFRYVPTGGNTTSQLLTFPLRGVNIFNNQLYATNATGRVLKIGTGLPTSGAQTPTNFGIIMGDGDSQVFFADLNPAIPGVDVLYAAHAFAGLVKYSYDGTSWVSGGIIGTDEDDYRYLSGTINGSVVTLYAKRLGSSARGEVVTITDASGHGGTISGTPSIIVGAGINTGFRGVSIVPQPPAVSLSVKTFLQGPYNTSLGRHKNVTATWASVLNASALNQPYNVAPFNYAGTESVSSGFFTANDGVTTDIVDWVLVELRDATTPATIIARKACFIREDGKVVDLDGTSDPSFTGVGANNYYVVIKHRNHLPVRSATTVFVNGATPVLYDFTTAQAQAFQNPAVTLNAAMKDFSGVFCMWGGNVNANNNTKYTGPQNDALALLAQLSANQAAIVQLPGGDPYKGGDVNLDGVIRYTGPNNDALALLAVLSANQAAVITEHQ
jgi:hypothetical protein